MALLWFPPVGLNEHYNPLEQLRLQFLLITCILTSWTILKIFYVASTITTLLLSCKFKTHDILSYAHNTGLRGKPYILASWIYRLGYTCHTWTCFRGSSNSFNKLVLYLNISYLCILAYYILLNHTNACSLIFLLKENFVN
jgi:hypothetical protein